MLPTPPPPPQVSKLWPVVCVEFFVTQVLRRYEGKLLWSESVTKPVVSQTEQFQQSRQQSRHGNPAPRPESAGRLVQESREEEAGGQVRLQWRVGWLHRSVAGTTSTCSARAASGSRARASWRSGCRETPTSASPPHSSALASPARGTDPNTLSAGWTQPALGPARSQPKLQ